MVEIRGRRLCHACIQAARGDSLRWRAGNRLMLQLDDPGWLNRRNRRPAARPRSPDAPLRDPPARDGSGLAPASGAHGRRHVPPGSCPRWRRAATRCTAISCTPTGSARPLTAEIDLPEIARTCTSGRRCGGCSAAIAQANYNPVVSELPGGYRMIWEGGGGTDSCAAAIRVPLPPGRCAPGALRRIWNCTWECSGHAAFVATDRQRVCARASIGLGADGGAGTGARARQSTCGAHGDGRGTARRRCPSPTDFRSRARTASSCR